MERNILYNTNTNVHSRHKLDIYRPQIQNNYPVLMFVSGGGWTTGSKEWIANVRAAFAAKGVGVVTVDHRLVPEVNYAGQVEDLALAFAWLKENIATYGGDPNRIMVGGHSAGGHLIGLLATDKRYLAQVGYDVSDIVGTILISPGLAVYHYAKEIIGDDDVVKADVLSYVQAGLNSFLLLVAEDDLADVPNSTQKLADSLKAIDVPVELLTIKNRDHFNIVQYIGDVGDETTEVMYKWIMDN